MRTIALFGANGFVGSSLLLALSKTGRYKITQVTRDNYLECLGKFYNVVINSAMPSARFWAKNNPEKDFQESVQKTADIFYGCTFDKFVQISTVSARCQLDTIYGRHKLAAENLCNCDDNLIVRLGAMFGAGLEKGALIDILSGHKVFVDSESRYSFCSVEFVGNYIATHLGLTGVVEVGAIDTLSLKEITEYLGIQVEFDGPIDTQIIQNPDPKFPHAKDVYQFLDQFKANKTVASVLK